MSQHKLKVALICGGRSGEREISLKSAGQVAGALDPDRYEVFRFDPPADLEPLIQAAPNLDVALIILHGRWGEDGTVQGLLELLDLPYQGSGVLSSALCMDKRASKELYRFHGLPVAPDMVLDRKNEIDPDEVIERLGLPVVVKPASDGSSLGLTICRGPQDLASGLARAFALDRFVIVEEYIEGREITVPVWGNDRIEALPLIEIRPGRDYEFYDYDAKYIPGATEEICPAPIDDDLARQAREIGIKAHQALYCRGYSRTDLMLRNGRFYVLETNTIPGMTETSLFPLAAKVAGYSFGQMMDRLIELALERS
ncbi:MAG: D-alanine--D-alanine ligase [Proteobacteria bacterium]|nr:D-alanine--D-alanine ligase [Pseudomonadota bacterium]